MLSRRGFLQTLAAAVGTAVFEPVGSLWIPTPPSIVPVSIEAATPVQQVIDQQVELTELAMMCANRLGDRLTKFQRVTHDTLILREVVYEQTGHVHLEKMLLRVPDVGTVHFAPVGERCVGFTEGNRRVLPLIVDSLMQQVDLHGADIFAPIGRELRPGDAFSNDTLIALATDPLSGLSVRVIQFEHDGPRRRTMYGLEVAGGTRKSRHRGASLIGGV